MRMKYLVCLFVLITFHTQAQKWRPGHYYSQTGERIEGLLQHKYAAQHKDRSDNYVLFKASEGGKSVKLTTKEMKAFVIASDSFTIINHFSIPGIAVYVEDFVQVLEVGEITLYKHFTTGVIQTSLLLSSRADVVTLIMRKNRILTVFDPKEFKKEYQTIFEGDDALIAKIRERKRNYHHVLQDYVKEYNEWSAAQKL